MKKTILALMALSAMMLFGTKMSAQTSIGFYNGARAYVNSLDGASENKSGGAYIGGISFEQNLRGRVLGLSVGADLGLAAKNDFLDVKDSTLLESYLDIPVRAKLFIPFGPIPFSRV